MPATEATTKTAQNVPIIPKTNTPSMSASMRALRTGTPKAQWIWLAVLSAWQMLNAGQSVFHLLICAERQAGHHYDAAAIQARPRLFPAPPPAAVVLRFRRRRRSAE